MNLISNKRSTSNAMIMAFSCLSNKTNHHVHSLSLIKNYNGYIYHISTQCNKSSSLIGSDNKSILHTRERCTRIHYSSMTRLFSSSSSAHFEAPEPPSFTGQPTYPNIDMHKFNLNDDDNNNNNNDDIIERNNHSYKRNSDPNAIYVITGASRGIGLQMVKTLSKRVQGTIIACCRDPTNATLLQSYINDHHNDNHHTSNIVIHPLDLENQSSINTLKTFIEEKYNNRVDILLNVAGLLGDGGITTPGPERSIKYLDREWVEKVMAVNFLGPLFLSQALSPMMMMKRNTRNSKSRDPKNTSIVERQSNISIIVNLSARVGSISDNGLGGWISYRSSKSALNQATKTMSLELKRHGIWTIALHPGTTDTDLSKPFQRNVKDGRLFPVEFTVDRLLNVIDCMEEEHSGGFYDWSGTALPF